MAKVKKSKEELEQEKKEKALKKANEKEQKKLERKEANKEKFDNVKKTFNMYAFVVKLVAAVILIAFAILILVNQKYAEFIIFLVTAGVTIITAIIRAISIGIKKDEKSSVKKVTLVVVLIHAVISAYLLVSAIVYKNELDSDNISGFTKFNLKYFPIMFAAILYVEAVGYFMNTVLYKVESGKFMFWLHIIYITLAVVILSFANSTNTRKMVIALAIISLVCALFIGTEAIVGYFNYRNGIKKESADKVEDTKKEETGVEAPSNDDHEPLIDPNVINDKNDNDSAIIQ